MLYEGGTRVVALANWPGQIKPGAVNEVVHVVDMFLTLAGLAGADPGAGKPLDGIDAWPVISQGRPSARSEVVYNVEPFRAGIRQGDWKLVWRTPLPSALELYNIALDPQESTDLSATEPDKVAMLKKRAEQLAGESEKALFLVETQTAVMGMVKDAPPVLPNEPAYFIQGD
jgi:arylsulfatase A-like enzyme